MDVPRVASTAATMNNKLIVIRADASLDIGTGHLMRCLTLADALKAKGHECHFICRRHPGNLIEYVRQQGHMVHALPYVPAAKTDDCLAHARWLGSTQAQDAALCAPIIKMLMPRWLVVDHYALDARWERLIRHYCQKLMVIDDLADRSHQCDVLLVQTFGRNPSAYLAWVSADCTVLCGAHYALLRPEFAASRTYSLERRRSAPLRRVLVTLGGMDKDNVTGQVLKALAATQLPPDCLITVVMGATAPWLEAVQQTANDMPVSTEVRSGVSNMAQLMADSDLAIGAAGATSWERCCLGLPTIMIVLADNQRVIAQALLKAGAAFLADTVTVQGHWLITDQQKGARALSAMSDSAAAITDGLGTSRVINFLSR